MPVDQRCVGLLRIFCEIHFAILLVPEIQIITDADGGWLKDLSGVFIFCDSLRQSRFRFLFSAESALFDFLSFAADLSGIKII